MTGRRVAKRRSAGGRRRFSSGSMTGFAEGTSTPTLRAPSRARAASRRAASSKRVLALEHVEHGGGLQVGGGAVRMGRDLAQFLGPGGASADGAVGARDQGIGGDGAAGVGGDVDEARVGRSGGGDGGGERSGVVDAAIHVHAAAGAGDVGGVANQVG